MQAPGLAVVIVGERKDSQTYVRMKKKACAEVGIQSFGCDLPATATQDEVLAVVKSFNANPDVHGILVQLPLPKHINEQTILSAVSVEKDVDGFHPLNIGQLCMKGRDPLFVPCTPAGCIELLVRTGVQIKGKRAVVVGRSNIVGMPVALLLNKADATVTICHSATQVSGCERLPCNWQDGSMQTQPTQAAANQTQAWHPHGSMATAQPGCAFAMAASSSRLSCNRCAPPQPSVHACYLNASGMAHAMGPSGLGSCVPLV